MSLKVLGVMHSPQERNSAVVMTTAQRLLFPKSQN